MTDPPTDPRPAPPEPAMQILSRHGIDCPKVLHIGEGYLHSDDYDGPYYVDGILYCGRCHGWTGTSAAKAEPAPTAAVATGTEQRAKRWRVGLNGTAYMGMYLVHENGVAGPELRMGDSAHGYVAHEDVATLETEIERLQRALAFWLPGVPADDPEVAQRAGDDAYLLAGYQGGDEPSAEERGWISLREAP